MKSVFVVGASSGFGRNTALALAAEGWDVFAGMRDVGQGRSLLEESADCVGRIALVEIDVSDPASVQTGMGEVLAGSGGRLDALFCNAGFGQVGFFEELSDAQCRAQMETNFFGTLAVVRFAIPVMREARKGRIVVVSSNSVNTPHPMLSMYAASKWALEGWAEAIAMELAPFGVEVVVVQPGAHRTPFAANVRFHAVESSPYAQWLAQAMPGLGDLDRWGRAPESATRAFVAAVGDLASPFRVCIGEDTVAFNRLKGCAPYEWRAWATRAIVGLPQPGAFVPGAVDSTIAQSPTASSVSERLTQAMAADPEFSRLLAGLLTEKSAGVG